MKKYEIKIEGQVYRVEVQELPDNAEMEKVVPLPVAKEVPSTSNQEGQKILAPMFGSILKVLVNPGQAVKEGDTLLILEAMKMENEIVAPKDGTVKQILAKVNESVESGQALVIL